MPTQDQSNNICPDKEHIDDVFISLSNNIITHIEEKTIHKLFEKQVKETPNATAVIYEDESCTYAELNSKANQLAHYLHRLNINPNDLIAICLERSLNFVIAMLGALKAGAAYVPLSTDSPVERLHFMLSDTKASLVITETKLEKNFLSYSTPVLNIDNSHKDLIKESQENIGPTANSKDLAYIIYTSGTTGKPKGVMIEHESIYDRLLWCQSYCPLANNDSFLHLFSFGFDGAVISTWWPLSVGAVVIIPKMHGMSDSDYLIALMNKQKVTILFSTPTILNLIFSRFTESGNKNISYVISGGEKLTVDLLCKLKRLVPHVYNFYGPTECSVMSTAWNAIEHIPESQPPIGRPIVNTYIYILDKDRQQVPMGEVGELYIGGIGLARGYLNRPELTEEVFISDPFTVVSETKLYKTGDLGRYLPDGNIEYLGRVDSQVKLLGYRIELGEIETVLEGHEDIVQAVVVIRDISNQQRLVAYVVHNEGTLLGKQADTFKQELRDFLENKLPKYMVPGQMLFLDRLPLTANGKIDFNALPTPQQNDRFVDVVLPRTELEEKLAIIWSTLLQAETIGIHDNFFEMGGDSIISIQLISYARKQGINLDIEQIFATPTIAGLAESSDTYLHKELDIKPFATPAQYNIDKIFKHTDKIENIYPLSPMQEGLLFQAIRKSDLDTYFLQAIFQLTGKVDQYTLFEAWQYVTNQYSILRTEFVWENLDVPLQYTLSSIVLPWEVHDWQEFSVAVQKQQLETLLHKDSLKQFNVLEAPLFRLHFVQLSENMSYLIWSFHHIIIDGWSMWLILQGVFKCYEQIKQSKQPQLNHNRPYWEYISWLQQQDIGIAEKFWCQYLAGFKTPTQLCTKEENSGTATPPTYATYEHYHLFLSTLETDQLQKFARQHQLTLNTVIQGAWAVLLSRYSQQHDIIFGVTVSGRSIDLSGIEQMIGLFINTLPLRVQFSSTDEILSVFHRIQKQMSQLQRYSYVPLGKIKSWSEISGTKSLFDSIIVFENYPVDENKPISDLYIKSIPGGFQKTEFPLTIGVLPHEQLSFYFGYEVTYFTKENIEYLAESLKKILRKIAKLGYNKK